MLLFFKKILSFFIVLLFSLLVLTITSNLIIGYKGKFKINRSINSIILGNSQPECAFNDSLISNFKNLSKPAETYFYTYQKLEQITSQNMQIENVFVEFNPTSILSREDKKIWLDRYLEYHLPNYFPFLSYKDHKLLILNNPLGYQRTLLKSVKDNIIRISLNDYNYSIGGYRYLVRHKIDVDSNSIEYNKSKLFDIGEVKRSQINLIYLEKIIQLCKNKNLNVYLIRSPYHKKFIGNLYEPIFQEIRQKRFGHIPFLDFKDFQLNNNEFGDLQHLNHLGAKKFSIWFNNWLINNETIP